MRRQATNQKAPSDAMDVDGRHAADMGIDDDSNNNILQPELFAGGNTGFTEQDFVRFV